MKFFAALLFVLTTQVYAQDNAFRLNVGSLASGLSYTKEKLDLDGGDDSTETEAYHITIGYLRHIGWNVQLLGNFSQDFKNTKTGDDEVENKEMVMELGALYNFQSEIKKSFYAGILYYHSKRTERKWTATTESDSDGTVNGIEFTVGKRFSLTENLSYIISADYITSLSFSGDYSDVYDGGSIIRVNLLNLEYYF